MLAFEAGSRDRERTRVSPTSAWVRLRVAECYVGERVVEQRPASSCEQIEVVVPLEPGEGRGRDAPSCRVAA
jgi:hypothetical protein